MNGTTDVPRGRKEGVVAIDANGNKLADGDTVT